MRPFLHFYTIKSLEDLTKLKRTAAPLEAMLRLSAEATLFSGPGALLLYTGAVAWSVCVHSSVDGEAASTCSYVVKHVVSDVVVSAADDGSKVCFYFNLLSFHCLLSVLREPVSSLQSYILVQL